MAPRISDRISRSYQSAATDRYIEQLCTSWILPPWILCAVRAAISIYAFFTIFYIIGYRIAIGQTKAVQQSFSYFTVLGYWAWLSTSLSPPRIPLHMRFEWSTGVLSKDAFVSQFSTWTNVSEHAMNSAFAIVELALPRSQPHPWINIAPLILILAFYLGLAYITHETQGIYVCEFLDPSNGSGSVAGYCFGILAAAIVIFIIVRYLQALRLQLTEKKPSLPALSYNQHDSEALELSHLPKAAEFV